MTLIRFEGFETSGSLTGLSNEATTRPELNKRFDSVYFIGTPSTEAYHLMTSDDTTGYAMHGGTSNFRVEWYWNIPSAFVSEPGPDAPVFIFGMRVHIPTERNTYLMLFNGASFTLASIYIVNSEDIEFRNAFDDVLFTATGALTPGAWQYLEVRLRAGENTDGLLEVRVDGVTVISEADVETFNFNLEMVSIAITKNFNNTTPEDADDFVAFDDIYLLVDDATAPNDFLYPCRIKRIPVVADGSVNDFSPSSGSVNFALVDELGNVASDYVSTSTNSDIDMYVTDTTAPNATIYAVKVEAEAILDAAGTISLAARILSGGDVSSTTHTVDSTAVPKLVNHYAVVDPDTSSAWTTATLNDVEIGVQVVSGF